ncbi:MAG: NAD(P)/FAD-dependent oxidoreductase, partial [Chloroflexota bacterium]
IGAGIGGLTAGALLLQAGYPVTVLEAHIYPGGSAGTFYHQKYRFDAGATLAGGFSPGGPHARLAQILDLEWPVRPADPAWLVHLPDGRTVTQWSDPARWREEWLSAFPDTGDFWRTQEMLADISWDISSRPFPWPPQKAGDFITLARALRPATVRALPYLFRNVGDLAPKSDPMFSAFLDGQLLISAQTTADKADALYGSAALDLPRRGVNHVQGGIGSLAQTLADWIEANGGQVLYRQQVERVEVKDGRAVAIRTQKGLRLEGEAILANVTPWALVDLLGEAAPPQLRREVNHRQATWGAFTLYLGLDTSLLPEDLASHHQVIMDAGRPLGEGNSVFISLADLGDPSRGPEGKIPATLSTHTAIAPWWQLYHEDRDAYRQRRAEYVERMVDAAVRAIPGLNQAIELCLPGTPVTFDFYTRRPRGMVGGFPQTSLFSARGPKTGIPNLWLVGDSIFPGQSTAGVTLGAMRVATDVLDTAGYRPLSRPATATPLAVGE